MSMSVKDHYGKRSSPEILKKFFDTAKEKNYKFTHDDLAALDQFHIGGLVATERLADLLSPDQGATVLDIGSGIGGPARYLESRFRAAVTGIDITPEYVEIAQELNAITGAQVKFIAADALCTGLPEASFDALWTQHVAMNISERRALYAEFARLTKPGGKLAIYDVLKKEGGAVEYPVPWSFDGSGSYVCSEAETISLINQAGFTLVKNDNVTAAAIDWLAQRLERPPEIPVLSDIMGAGFREAAINLRKQLCDGKLAVAQMLFCKKS